MIQEDNVMIFSSDDEFINFCLCSDPIMSTKEINGKEYVMYDYGFTNNYNYALANNIMFRIDDENSKVMKRGAVNRGIITKKISNLIY